MSAPGRAVSGVRALRKVLREQTCDVRGLDDEGFLRWLEQQSARWRRDPTFQERMRIRDLRRSRPEIRALEREHRRLAAEDAVSPQFSELERMERELIGAGRAIAGLTGALGRVAAERRPAIRQKLKMFHRRRRSLQEQHAVLVQSSAARLEFLRVDSELKRLRSACGLDREERRLARLLTEQGRRGGRAGESFERTAMTLAQREIVPDLLRRRLVDTRVLVLQGVALGAARVELDQVIVRAPRREDRPVEVLAIVEVKRNINDLAHGFRGRQENLAWLTGDAAGYDPEAYRTRRFRSGHFEGEAVHVHEGESLVFTRRSFRLFHRDPDSGFFLTRLYFITRCGPVCGLSSAALGRLAHRIATDEHWAPDDEAYLRRLRRWVQSLAEPCETPDVLQVYAAATSRGRQILLLPR